MNGPLASNGSEPAVHPPRPLLRGAATTHTGVVRNVNQDRVLVVDGRMYGVADGMGGHRAGEVAATIAVESIARLVNDAAANPAGFGRVIEQTNTEVFNQSVNHDELAGMGTTLTALVLVDDQPGTPARITIANVGDSRTYRFRSGELEQLTEDHSLVGELVRDGVISEEQAKTHPRRSVMTRALGVEPDIDVDVIEVLISRGDRFLLCSDGLHGVVTDARMESVLRRIADPDEASRELLQLALAGGGPDNVSVVVVDVVDDGDQALAASALFDTAPPSVANTGRISIVDEVDSEGTGDGIRRVPRTETGSYPLTGSAAWKRPTSRLVTPRVILALAILGAVGAVALWAILNGESGTVTSPTTTVGTVTSIDPYVDTVPSLTTVPSLPLPGLSTVPGLSSVPRTTVQALPVPSSLPAPSTTRR
jgi:serine/threonine protein phosphatase PrpC